MSKAQEIVCCLKLRHETISVAESCTGGGLANEITTHPGIAEIFLGGVISYSNAIKECVLHLPQELISKKGAVSEEVALLMAKNCRELFCSTWALSTTGIAGPSGGSKEKPQGLVWIGLAGPHILVAKRYLFANTTRLEHRHKTIEEALRLLAEQISKNTVTS
jgi:nicotinamide-nucleotide amidase